MKRLHIIFAFIIILFSLNVKAQTPIVICPDVTSFTSMTRGYYFTAPTSFTICGIYVEDDRSTSPQSVEIVRFTAGPPPAYASTTNSFVSLFYQNNYVPNNMITVPNVVVNAGDIIGVYGSRATVNSYGQSQCPVTIGGFPVTLFRSGMQFDLATQQMHDIWNENNYYIGRVTIYTNCCPPPAAIPAISGPVSVCEGDTVTYTVPAQTGAVSYNWVVPVGATIISGQNSTSLNVAWTAAPGGQICIDWTDACSTSPQTCLDVVVNPTPTVTVPLTTTYCNGDIIPATTFVSNPAGGTFSWTNSNTSIGIGASGIGDIPAFTATNSGASTITGTITVTPTANGCTGIPSSYDITVNPSPTVTVPANNSYCSGDAVPASAFSSSPVGGTYSWTNSNIAIGLAASGIGDTPPFTATNTSGATIISTVSVTPTVNGCVGSSSDYTITVFQTPVADAPADVTVCDSYTLPALTVGNYFTGTGGTGTALFAGDIITTTQTIYVYAETATTPNCTDENSFVVTINQTPTLTLPANANYCNGDPVPASAFVSSVTGSSFGWTNDNTSIGLAANGIGDTPPFNATNTTSNSQISTITVIATANGCVSASSNYTITVFPDIELDTTFIDPQCNGSSDGSGGAINITGTGPYSYIWSNLDTTQNITGLPANTYYVTVTDSYGCTGVNEFTLTYPSQITATSSSTPENCGLGDGSVTVTGNGGTGLLTYTLGSTQNTTGVFPGLSAGAFTVTITDANSCTITEIVSVTGSGSVTAGFTASPDQCLNGNSFDFTNTGDTGAGITYSWSFPSGTPATYVIENPVGITWNTPGTYTVSQTVSLGGCNDSYTLVIEVFAHPTPTISFTDVVCNGACDGTASVDQIYTGYLWDNGVTNQTITNLCDNSYCVTVIDANMCTATECVTISQPQGISISSETSTDVTCNGDNNGSIVVSANGGVSPLTYDIGTIQNQSGSFFGLNGNTYYVTITDANLCTIVSNALVVSEPDAITIDSQTYQDISCYGLNDGSINIAASGGFGNLTYSYNGSPQSNGDFINLSGNIYNVTITDDNSCSITTGFTINEPQEFIISISPDQNICNGQSATITATAVGGVQPHTYIWSNTSINSQTINVSPTNETTYSVYIQDANACISNTLYSTVSVSPAIALEAIPSTASVCPGDPSSIVISPSSGAGPPYMIHVDNNLQSSPYIVYPNETTTYNITATDACGSTADTTVTINVYDLPSINIQSNPLDGCQPLTVNFVETSEDLGQTYSWNLGDSDHNNLAFDKTPIHEYEDPGTYDVSLTVVSAEGCTNTNIISDMITVYPSPTAKFIAAPSIVSIIKPIVNFTNLSILNDTSYWYFGDGDSSNTLNPTHTYQQYPTGTYNAELVVASEHGCRDTAFSNIQVEDEYTLYAPTAFSPDFDGINDEFKVYGNGIDTRNFHLLIYDRWGEVIWETNDINEGWDGRVKGGAIGYNAVYSWLVIYKDTKNIEHQNAGAVTIIR